MKRQVLRGLLLAAIAGLLLAGLEIARLNGLVPRPARDGSAPSSTTSNQRSATLQPRAFVKPLNPGDGASSRNATVPSNRQRLDQIVDSAVAHQNGTYGVAVKNLSTGETALVNADDFFPSASLYKLAVMYEVFRQQSTGDLSLSEVLTVRPEDLAEAGDDDALEVGDRLTIEQALERMIEISSNVAAYMLAHRVGWDRINQTMDEIGLDHTRVPAGTWKARVHDWRAEFASTSPSDLLTFFERLHRHQLIGVRASDQMLQLLLNQQINDRLPANLPPGTSVAHKTGNLDGIVNDAGIVYGPRADFIVVILSRDVDEGAATSTEAKLTRALYDYFNGTSR